MKHPYESFALFVGVSSASFFKETHCRPKIILPSKLRNVSYYYCATKTYRSVSNIAESFRAYHSFCSTPLLSNSFNLYE